MGAIKQVLVMVAFSPTEAREIKVSSPTKARELMQGALRGALLLVVHSKLNIEGDGEEALDDTYEEDEDDQDEDHDELLHEHPTYDPNDY